MLVERVTSHGKVKRHQTQFVIWRRTTRLSYECFHKITNIVKKSNNRPTNSGGLVPSVTKCKTMDNVEDTRMCDVLQILSVLQFRDILKSYGRKKAPYGFRHDVVHIIAICDVISMVTHGYLPY